MKVFSIRPGLPFVDALAAGLLAQVGGAPEALAAAQVMLPTRRACRALTLAFLRQTGGRPLLLPKMTPLGDIDEDDLAFEPGEEGAPSAIDIPPAIPSLRRQLLLARQITHHLSPTPSPAQAAQLAAELARLFDQVHAERLDLRKLDQLVPDEYARHWQITLGFLKPIAQWWKEKLDAEQCLDPADRRNRLLAAQAAAWRVRPPSTPVIAAGSTGSMPTTAELLKVVASLPFGALVLPGLDTEADDATWKAISLDAADPDFPLAQSHPQYGLARLLRHLGVDRGHVRPWPAPGIVGTTPDRARVVSRALAPAVRAEGMRDVGGLSRDALDGLSIVETATPEEEARVIALIMREALEQDDLTAALVTPDRMLARRVAAELQRWNIDVDDSGGEPLAQQAPAAFLRLVIRMAVEGFAPVPLLAALKHPLAAGRTRTAVFRQRVRELERLVLRGLRPAPGLDGLRCALEARGGNRRSALELIDTVERATSPLLRLLEDGPVSLAQILQAHVAASEALAGTDTQPGQERLWAGDAGEALADFIAELTQSADDDLTIRISDYPELLDNLMSGRVVRPRWGRHPRLAIWGPLEARLQRSDVMVLGGLNEESWPPQARPNPWMNRPMMQAFGLPLPERRIGLSAHDFCQAFSSPQVWLTRARRKEGAPTVPSRWLLRLRAALHNDAWGAGNARTQARLLHWQRLLDAPRIIAPAPPPAPRPPIAARPRQLSVTQIETWLRDPYAIYARFVLNLRALEPLNAEPDAAHFGTFIHAALAAFLTNRTDPASPEAQDQLIGYAKAAIGDLLERPGVRVFWWPRFERIARWFIESERVRRCQVLTSTAEIQGSREIEAPGGRFLLTAKADRIDTLADQTLAIIDYKTGEPPKQKHVLDGYSPQLPLEAAIAEAGGFRGLAAAEVTSLQYWRLRGDDKDGEQSIREIEGLGEAALGKVQRLIATFDIADTPYTSFPCPHLPPRNGDYEHLARVKEWSTGAESGE